MTTGIRCAWRLVAGFLTVAAVTTLVTTEPAAAGVVVEPANAPKGAVAPLVFTARNERPAAIVALEVEMPDGVTTFVPGVPPGWAVAITGQTVRWTGGRIAVGGATTFPLRLGPLPSTEAVTFRVTESYEDGVTERWDGPPSSAAHPGPAMVLTGVAPPPTTTITGPFDHDHPPGEAPTGAGSVTTPAAGGTNTLAGAAAIGMALVGLLVALGWAVFVNARVRERKGRPSALRQQA